MSLKLNLQEVYWPESCRTSDTSLNLTDRVMELAVM